MTEDNELRYVVGAIYDAALNPTLWPSVLARIAAFVGGPSRALSARELMWLLVNTDEHVGHDVKYAHSETCGKFDLLATLPLFDAGQILGSQVLGSQVAGSQVLGSQGMGSQGASLQNMDLQPTGVAELKRYDRRCDGHVQQAPSPAWGDVGTAVVEKSENGCPSVPTGNEMHRRMILVAPHARRAILIGRAIGRKADEAAIFADILDSLTAGFFLIDAAGRIVHANSAGREILGADDFLRTIDGRLVVRDKKVNQTLQRIFAGKDEPETDGEIGSKGVALPLVARDGEYHIAHVLPLGSHAPYAADAPGAAAAMFVSKATLETPSSAEVIRDAYQLTRTELRVLLAIVNVGGIREIATTIGIADCTVKTHVRRLLEKTGADRQTDLIKLVAGFFTPLVA
jgi:DNA-binding CsgD family transcriptional regulator/PAS domain-containing protein